MHKPTILSFCLLLLSAVIALKLGFFTFDGAQAVGVVKYTGYWVMLTSVTLLVHNFILRVIPAWRIQLTGWRRIFGAAVFIITCSIVLSVIQPTGYKITMDEPVLSATALRMHEYKEVMTTARAHDLQGIFTQLDGYVDKRPYFYPFLVSLLHDFTGFRSSNTFLLNALLAPVFLSLLFISGNWVCPRSGGYFSVLLFMTVPLLAMNVNGGGFDLLNLVMILGTAVSAKSYLDRPNLRRLDTLVLLCVLLAQSRYESVAYIFAVGLVVLIGWHRAGKMLISPVLLLVPLLLIPYPLQQAIFRNHQEFWQLENDAVEPFMAHFIPQNLAHAADFFFNWSDDQQPNSLLLSLLFVSALIVSLLLLIRKFKKRDLGGSVFLAISPFAVVVLFNFFLLMAYHWGQIDEIIATRIVLPFILFQVLFVTFVIGVVCASRVGKNAMLILIVGYFMGVTVPLCARSTFLKWVPDQHMCQWFRDQVVEYQDESVLFVSNMHIVALAERVPAIPEIYAKNNKAKLELIHSIGSYEYILFAYELARDSGTSGPFRPVTPVLKNFDLETLVEAKIDDHHLMRIGQLQRVRWSGDDARDLDLSGFDSLDERQGKLEFFSRLLP
jgi:hypothetical protein